MEISLEIKEMLDRKQGGYMEKLQLENTRMERLCTYEDFPPAQDMPLGMKMIEGNYAIVECKYYDPVIYAVRDNYELHLHIVRPVSDDETENNKIYPCIAFVKGSAWRKQNLFEFIPLMAKLAKRGFVVIEIEYRPTSVACFPAQIEDAKTAIRFIKMHAEELHIYPNKIVLWGDSSGGHTAVMVGVTQNTGLFDSDLYSDYTDEVACIIDWYGVTNIISIGNEPSAVIHTGYNDPGSELLGHRLPQEHPELAKTTLPMEYISEDKVYPPFLIIHGAKDRLVPFVQSVHLYNALRECNKEVELYKLVCGDHAGYAFWDKEVLDIMESFIRKHI